ncbi:MAG TPA: UDP-N-acetylglucosamine--N-acetylmuramyl-(pentapeptide) pyrophosphoryl-undecaprenol N-acetylglucosamine transferase [Tepidisphaeraceae bacterium]|jgi:UDP-N-acetylglucosamine--N-acetylmuramyl-(pentapeptide) pyrophosphoryl-undecaprenol N-acetylglucosamine transferase|nr:UDP-N-acetylglucosamine--N-acetylmuramyl-(pentapeptide) pyrophosphoryl-undecaprenol N-acetylglucosamine transferase [Tepidisphaeraceae bacterium]
MPNPITIFLAGGGTGGHLYPGIAVAQSLVSLNPDIQPVFLCTTREIDKVILDPTGFTYIPQPIIPPVRTVAGLLKFWTAWRETKDLVRKLRHQHHPRAVLGLGGYAAGVAVKYCATHKIPAAVLNPDVIPGKANQYLLRYCQSVCCQFAQTAQHVPAAQQSKLQITGCPIRSDILTLPDRPAATERLGLDPALQTLVITGASQGAQTVNDAVLASLPQLNLQGWQVLHLAGRDHGEKVRTAYRELNLSARVIDFTPAMSDVWAVADLCVSRSGASSCAELTACGIPSILMPYPFHKDLHQRANAKVLADANAAILLDDQADSKKNAEKLTPILASLLYDLTRRQAMQSAARKLGRPDAAAAVAQVILDMLRAG